MKYRPIRPSRTRGSILNKVAAIIRMVIGGIMCMPFAWHMLFAAREPYMSLWTALGVLLMVVGGPIFFIGFFNFIIRNPSNGTVSTVESDVQRIRFAAEAAQQTKK